MNETQNATTPVIVPTKTTWTPEENMQVEWFMKGYFAAREEYAGF